MFIFKPNLVKGSWKILREGFPKAKRNVLLSRLMYKFGLKAEIILFRTIGTCRFWMRRIILKFKRPGLYMANTRAGDVENCLHLFKFSGRLFKKFSLREQS